MRALVFGASAGLGRSLSRELAARGYALTLVARDARDLEAEAAHCRSVFGVDTDWIALDAADPLPMSTNLKGHLDRTQHRFQVLLFPVGGALDCDAVGSDAASILNTVNTNLTSIMTAISVLKEAIANDGARSIVGFGSIAAIRGRKANVAYAAAKRGLESFFESLRHDSASSGLVVQFYRLGYLDTQQAYGRKTLLPPVAPATIAKYVIDHLHTDLGLRTLPRYWYLPLQVLRLLPWPLFRRISF